MDYMLLVGVDAGGTKTASVSAECVSGKGKILNRYVTKGANFHNVGLRRAYSRIATAVREVSGDRKPDVVVLGIAGLDSKYDEIVLRETLKDLGGKVVMDNDSFFVLYGNVKGGKGAVTISGTGSVVLGYDGTNKIRAEGAGWFLSDTGSAYWVGREALRYVTRVLQGREEGSPMVERIMRSIRAKDLDDIIYWAYHKGHRVERVAGIAKVVDSSSEAGDMKAKELLRRGAELLAEAAVYVARIVNVDQVIISGGMFSSTTYTNSFREVLSRFNLETRRTEVSPEYGALLYASRLKGCDLIT